MADKPAQSSRGPELTYRFEDGRLLHRALTHRSAASRHNERLEFLGDGVINFVVAGALYRNFSDAEEGRLSRLRARLVRRETLAALARELHLGEHVRLGPGEMKSGGHRRQSILADALEALVGAIYLDGGFAAAESFVIELYGQRLSEDPGATELKDPKTRLQEHLQASQVAVPEYRLVNTTGAEHERRFFVQCSVPELELSARGEGGSRRKAEQAAAEAVLEQLLSGDSTVTGG